jgi:hypothetical protein
MSDFAVECRTVNAKTGSSAGDIPTVFVQGVKNMLFLNLIQGS